MVREGVWQATASWVLGDRSFETAFFDGVMAVRKPLLGGSALDKIPCTWPFSNGKRGSKVGKSPVGRDLTVMLQCYLISYNCSTM